MGGVGVGRYAYPDTPLKRERSVKSPYRLIAQPIMQNEAIKRISHFALNT